MEQGPLKDDSSEQKRPHRPSSIVVPWVLGLLGALLLLAISGVTGRIGRYWSVAHDPRFVTAKLDHNAMEAALGEGTAPTGLAAWFPQVLFASQPDSFRDGYNARADETQALEPWTHKNQDVLRHFITTRAGDSTLVVGASCVQSVPGIVTLTLVYNLSADDGEATDLTDVYDVLYRMIQTVDPSFSEVDWAAVRGEAAAFYASVYRKSGQYEDEWTWDDLSIGAIYSNGDGRRYLAVYLSPQPI